MAPPTKERGCGRVICKVCGVWYDPTSGCDHRYIRSIMWLHPTKPLLYLDDDLGEYLQEMSFDLDSEMRGSDSAEFWELVLEWQKEVQK